MFQFQNPNFSVRLNATEKDSVNKALQKIQEENNIEYTFAKDVFLDVIQRITQPKETVKHTDTLEKPEVLELLNEFQSNFEIPENTPITELLLLALQKVNEPLPEAPTVEIEKPVHIEVEKPLSANQILITLNDDQLQVVKKVQQNRAKELAKNNNPEESLEELFIACFFDQGNIISFNGGWWTGL